MNEYKIKQKNLPYFPVIDCTSDFLDVKKTLYLHHIMRKQTHCFPRL